ncbi:MAG: T9SS type A sorting domain-containing protein [Bacteroidia bacterium]|nr:T9SS type A sorting domain-containing protein [Bacteroidia bacterium]
MAIRFFSLIILFFLSHSLFSQQNTVAGGADISGSGGSVSFSIGQIDHQTKTSASGTITEGVQQPYEIMVVTGIVNTTIQLSINAYPNPVVDQLVLIIDQTDLTKVFYMLTDVTGKLISEKKISASRTEIQFNELPQGIYFIKVVFNNKEVKVFKIIKN